jgi:putative serine protease PepD
MYLKPRVPPPVDAGTFDQSGLWINLAADGFAITDVAAGSPGAAAGLAAGDVITAIDGQRAEALTLWDARVRLREPPPGTVVHLAVLRAGVPRVVDLTLRSAIDAP